MRNVKPKSLGFDTEMKKIKRAFHLIKSSKKKKNSNYVPIKLIAGGKQNFAFFLSTREIFTENRFSSSLFFLLYYFFP